jgi:hypothetical protein
MFNNLEKLTADELVDATRLLKREKRQIEAIQRLHRSCGHQSINEVAVRGEHHVNGRHVGHKNVFDSFQVE